MTTIVATADLAGMQQASPCSPPLAVPRLGISTSVFQRHFSSAIIDALDAAAVPLVEVVGPVPQCPFDEPEVRATLRARLRDARVRVRSVHLPYGGRLDISWPDDGRRAHAVATTAAHLRAAAALGASIVVVHPSAEPISNLVRPSHLAAARRSLEELTAIAADVGVPLAVECLPRTCLGNTAAELAGLLAGLDAQWIGACIDVNHINLREPDLAHAVGVLAPRLLTLHCSENDGVDERHWMPGDPRGVVDWGAFYLGLGEAGYQGPFLYELRTLGLAADATLERIVENYSAFVTPQWQTIWRPQPESPSQRGPLRREGQATWNR